MRNFEDTLDQNRKAPSPLILEQEESAFGGLPAKDKACIRGKNQNKRKCYKMINT